METYHNEPSVLFQLEITYKNGITKTICSDGTETCRLGQIVYSDLYQVEKRDYRIQNTENHPVQVKEYGCNGVQREHNKKLNNGLPILHKVPPKRDYGRYFCIMAEKGGTSHGGLTEKLSPFFHAKKQEVNAYGR